MRSGRLRHPITIRQRFGNPPTWPTVDVVFAAIEPPHLPREGQQISLLAPWITSIITRFDPRIEAGQLLQRGHQWWWIDSIANQTERDRELRVNAREFIGRSAVYQPASGSAYPCMAWVGRSSDWVGVEALAQERRTIVQLLLPQLVHPYGQPGDQIGVQGQVFTVDGVERGGSQDAVLSVRVR